MLGQLADDEPQAPARSPDSRTPRSPRFVSRLPVPGADAIAAVVTWAVGLSLSAALVHTADIDPFTFKGALLPIAVGVVAGTALLVLVLRRPRSSVLIGAGAGGYAAWVGLVLLQALHGTPFGYG